MASVVANVPLTESETETDYRGSSDIRAVVDSAWGLKRDDGSGGGDPL